MPSTAVETIDDIVTTKEELERWKEERARQRQRDGDPTHPPTLEPSQSRRGGWQGDLNLLVAFLKGLKRLMQLLIDQRVPDEPAKRFKAVFSDVEQNVNWAISDLYDIANAEDPKAHPGYIALQARGLTDQSLKLKMAETDDRIHDSPPVAVLERFDHGQPHPGSIFPGACQGVQGNS